MRHAALLLFALTSSATLLTAQAPGGGSFSTLERLDGKGNSTVIAPPPAAPACPVLMHALQGANGGLMMARDAERIEGPSQRIHLVLAAGQARRITAARVTVRGLSGKGRSVETMATADPKPDRRQTLDVLFAAEDPTSVAADLALPGFTAILNIQLDEITYSDGTSWKMAGAQVCSVAPDLLVRVAGR